MNWIICGFDFYSSISIILSGHHLAKNCPAKIEHSAEWEWEWVRELEFNLLCFVAIIDATRDSPALHMDSAATSFPGFSPTRPTEGERETISLSRSVGRVGENPGNEVDSAVHLMRIPTNFKSW